MRDEHVGGVRVVAVEIGQAGQGEAAQLEVVRFDVFGVVAACKDLQDEGFDEGLGVFLVELTGKLEVGRHLGVGVFHVDTPQDTQADLLERDQVLVVLWRNGEVEDLLEQDHDVVLVEGHHFGQVHFESGTDGLETADQNGRSVQVEVLEQFGDERQ